MSIHHPVKIKGTLAALALMTGSAQAAVFVMNLSGTINSLQVRDVPGFPEDIQDGTPFTARFTYDLDFWQWRDVGNSFSMEPINPLAAVPFMGMSFVLEAGANEWTLDGPEFTHRNFLAVSDYRNGAFGTFQDSLTTDLGIISSTPPAAFPFYLGTVDLDLLFTDGVAYDFVTEHGPASDSNVILGNVDSQTMLLQSQTLSGNQGWIMDLEVSGMTFTTIPEPGGTAIALGLSVPLVMGRRRRTAPGSI